ncbi:MAG: phosphate/phosphite/phosphonate ABC transporter substrate-binding protein [Planctomycetes bacterium]|nr:phosphate/phosphite/phosphonate ABC transporter substrate-binding protein [Planctomycetota bacterium]
MRPVPRVRPSTAALLVIAALMLLCGLVPGCGEQGDETVSSLRVGILPDEDPEVLRQRHKLLEGHLGRTLGVRTEIIVPETYEELVTRFRDDELDLAYLGAFTFVAARVLADAEPIVVRQRDRRFVSYFIVPRESTAASLDDLGGARLAFGSRWSTSGHVMPRAFLLEAGIEPERFFASVTYTGSHDATAYQIRDGLVDVAAMNPSILDAMVRDGRLDHGDVRILCETRPYVNYVWAVRRDLPPSMRDGIREAFLSLDDEREEHRAVLDSLDADAFFPASPNDFTQAIAIVERLDLLEGLR